MTDPVSVGVSDYPIIFVNIDTILTAKTSASAAAQAAYACAYAVRLRLNPGDLWAYLN